MSAPSTALSRRIVVETPAGEYLTFIRTREHGGLPLTNPGHFPAGVYRGEVNEDGTATIREEAS